MSTTNPHPDVAVPAGAVSVGEWRLNRGRARSFHGTRRVVETVVPGGPSVHVDVLGNQTRDGQVDRYIWVNSMTTLSAGEARQLAGHLIAAADEIDALSDPDGSIER